LLSSSVMKKLIIQRRGRGPPPAPPLVRVAQSPRVAEACRRDVVTVAGDDDEGLWIAADLGAVGAVLVRAALAEKLPVVGIDAI
jgi:hypothetical protein